MSVPLNILLVEDDSDDYILTQELLGEIDGFSMNLQWETNYTKALAQLTRGQFDICLVDYHIGAENGVEFIAKANDLNIDVPMILVTGITEHSIDVQASEAGAAGFVEKTSLTSASLERAIRYALSRLQRNRLRRMHTQMATANLEDEIRQAICDRQFEVYLQPQVHCETKTIDKAEALVRWNHPSRGVLGPADFLPVAEETGLIVGIGKCVFDQVCRISSRLNALRNEIRIATNFSIVEMERHDFLDSINEALAANKTDPSTIEIELTESVAMDEPRLVHSHMMALREYGIKFAIDDFGTGYSGLAVMKDFPFETIKIDRSFVQTAEQSVRNRAIAKTIFYLADVLRLETVAEGVETNAQFAFVKNYGADYAQGHLFSKPLKFDEFQHYAHRMDLNGIRAMAVE